MNKDKIQLLEKVIKEVVNKFIIQQAADAIRKDMVEYIGDTDPYINLVAIDHVIGRGKSYSYQYNDGIALGRKEEIRKEIKDREKDIKEKEEEIRRELPQQITGYSEYLAKRDCEEEYQYITDLLAHRTAIYRKEVIERLATQEFTLTGKKNVDTILGQIAAYAAKTSDSHDVVAPQKLQYSDESKTDISNLVLNNILESPNKEYNLGLCTQIIQLQQEIEVIEQEIAQYKSDRDSAITKHKLESGKPISETAMQGIVEMDTAESRSTLYEMQPRYQQPFVDDPKLTELVDKKKNTQEKINSLKGNLITNIQRHISEQDSIEQEIKQKINEQLNSQCSEQIRYYSNGIQSINKSMTEAYDKCIEKIQKLNVEFHLGKIVLSLDKLSKKCQSRSVYNIVDFFKKHRRKTNLQLEQEQKQSSELPDSMSDTPEIEGTTLLSNTPEQLSRVKPAEKKRFFNFSLSKPTKKVCMDEETLVQAINEVFIFFEHQETLAEMAKLKESPLLPIVNSKFKELLGYEKEDGNEIVGLKFSELATDHDNPEQNTSFVTAQDTNRTAPQRFSDKYSNLDSTPHSNEQSIDLEKPKHSQIMKILKGVSEVKISSTNRRKKYTLQHLEEKDTKQSSIKNNTYSRRVSRGPSMV